ATSLLTTVPLTPAGFGFVEIAMVYVLTEGFGLAQSDAIAVAVVDRAVSVLSLIVVGAIVYVRTPHEERVGRRERPAPALRERAAANATSAIASGGSRPEPVSW